MSDVMTDVDKMIENGTLHDSDKFAVKRLYSLYDTQNGSVSDVQHDTISDTAKGDIRNAYDDTYTTMDHNTNTLKYGKYYYMREALMESVYLCPTCGISQDLTLDHYMPKSSYPALAMCRMNLVPLCGACNRVKNTKNYNLFVHPYYFNPNGGVFLKAYISVRQKALYVSFDIDEKIVSDYSMTLKMREHLKGLNIGLRLQNAVISFLQECFVGKYKNREELIKSLPEIMESYKNYGPNHWRLAVLRAIKELDDKGKIEQFIEALEYLNNSCRDLPV